MGHFRRTGLKLAVLQLWGLMHDLASCACLKFDSEMARGILFHGRGIYGHRKGGNKLDDALQLWKPCLRADVPKRPHGPIATLLNGGARPLFVIVWSLAPRLALRSS